MLESGSVALAGPCDELRDDPDVQDAYLGPEMPIAALMGPTALYLLFVWLLSAALASWLSGRKGYGEGIGLTSGLLLTFAAVLVWLAVPGRAGSEWGRGLLPQAGSNNEENDT